MGLSGLDGVTFVDVEGVLVLVVTLSAELIIDLGSKIFDRILSTEVLITYLLSTGVNGA